MYDKRPQLPSGAETPPLPPPPQAAPGRAPVSLQQAEAKRRATRTIWLAVLGVGVLLVVTFGALVVFSGRKVALSPAEREALLDIHDLAALVDIPRPDPAYERVVKEVYFDGTWELEYEYAPPAETRHPYLTCSLSSSATPADAHQAYLVLCAAGRAGVAFAGGSDDLVPLHNTFRWGDESSLWLVRINGIDAGNLFVARKDRKVFFLGIGGVGFSRREPFARLVSPTLEQVEQLSP